MAVVRAGRAVALLAAASMVVAACTSAAIPPRAAPPAGQGTGPAGSNCVDVGSWSQSERLAQLLMVAGRFDDLAASSAAVADGVGALVLFGQPAAGSGPAIRAGIDDLRAAATTSGQVAPWMATDEEGGRVARLASVIGAVPSPRQMAVYWSPSQITAAFASQGSAMAALGVTVDLAPVLDVAAAADTVADESDRSFSDDSGTVATDGTAAEAGLSSAGIVAVVKHFPGLGAATADTDLGPSLDPPLAVLEARDLLPFARAIAGGVPVVMVGHPVVPGLTGGLPASLSPATYSLLRTQLGFSGVALTDSLGAGAVAATGDDEASAALAALVAGADMVMLDTSWWLPTMTTLEGALEHGALSAVRVESSLERVLRAKGITLCR